jgi:hypothetical protein
MGFVCIAKLSRSPSSQAQALFLSAGWRSALPESLLLGLPGDLPQGFGGLAGVPSCAKSAETTRWTLIGVRRPASRSASPTEAVDPRRTGGPGVAA